MEEFRRHFPNVDEDVYDDIEDRIDRLSEASARDEVARSLAGIAKRAAQKSEKSGDPINETRVVTSITNLDSALTTEFSFIDSWPRNEQGQEVLSSTAQ
jgi:hypothetical protein